MGKAYGTICDYIGWRGDLSFDERDLIAADNFVLCFFSYIDLKSVWKAGSSMTVAETVSRLKETGGIHLEVIASGEHPEEFAEAAASSVRFGSVRILEHEDILIPEEHIQFSASLYELKKGELFLAYRGTDASTAGWKEDFMITFAETKAQKMALSFLKDQIGRYGPAGNRFYVGGHSKGGNLAMYASAMLDDEQCRLLKHIFVNDGPGFCRDVLDPALLEKIDHITTSVLPEYCVIGKLFEPHFSDVHIVQSCEKRILQHDCSTWLLEYGNLLEAERNDPESEWIDQVLNHWVENVGMDDRKRLINSMFDVIEEENGSFEDLTPKSFENILIRMVEMEPDIKKTMMKMPESVIRNTVSGRNQRPSELRIFLKKPELFSVFLFMTGILMTMIPENFVAVMPELILGGLFFLEAGVTLQKLRKSHFRILEEKTRIMVCCILLGLIIVMTVKENAGFLLGSAVFGTALLILAVNSYSRIRPDKEAVLPQWLSYIETAVLFVLGMFILVASDHTMRWYCSSAGYLMIADSIMRVILTRRTL